MYIRKDYIYFVCEGKTEENYLQLLNQTFRDCESFPVLHSVPIIPGKQTQDGHFRNLRPRFSSARKTHPRNVVYIVADDDIYVRNDKNNGTLLEKAGNIRDYFLFSTHQFEDFLMLHMPDDSLNQWLAFCRRQNHIKWPLHSEEYLPELYKHFPGYAKGTIPQQITSNVELSLARMLRHNREGKAKNELHSEFADLLESLVAKHGVVLPSA